MRRIQVLSDAKLFHATLMIIVVTGQMVGQLGANLRVLTTQTCTIEHEI